MADVTQTIAGDSTSAQRAYADVARQVTKLEEANAKLVRKVEEVKRLSEESANRSGSALSGQLRVVTDLVTQWASLTTWIQAANDAHRIFEETNAKASNAQISVADSQAQVIKNLAPQTTAEKIEFIAGIEKVQKDTKFPSLVNMNLAAAEGLSASGGDMKGVLDALSTAAPLAKDKPEELRVLMGAALDLKKASHVDSAKDNLGFLMQMGTESRIVSMRDTALNAAPAVSVAAATVTSDRKQATIDAGALFAALSNEAVDPTGETTRNAVTVITGELRSFFEKGVKTTIPGSSLPMVIKPKEDPNTIEGRIRVLQDNERLAKVFLENANFGRERFRIPFEQLLNRGQTDDQFQRARGNLSFDGRTVDQMTKELSNLTPQLELANAAREAIGSQEVQAANNSQGAIRDQIKTVRDEALDRTEKYAPGILGLGHLEQRTLRMWSSDFLHRDNRDYGQVAINELKSNRDWLLYKNRSLLGEVPFGEKKRDYGELSQAERNDYDYLTKQIEILNGLMAQQLRLMEQDAAKQRQPGIAPAMQGQREAHQER